MTPDVGRFLGMQAGKARSAAKAAGFESISEKMTAPPWGVRVAGKARVLRVRVTGPSAVEFVIGYEQITPDELQEPPR